MSIDPGTGTLRGMVRNEEGVPVRGASVSVFGVGPEPLEGASANDGSFTFEKVAEGTHFMRVTMEGFMSSSQDVCVYRGRATDVVFELRKGPFEIRGFVTGERGEPLKANVTLLRSGIVVLTAQSEEGKGAFRFRYLTEGVYEVQASSTCRLARSWSGRVSAKTKLNLTLPLVDGCTTTGKCEVCGETKEVKYCGFCHAYICGDCRRNYPERIKAMIRRRLARTGRSPEAVDRAYDEALGQRNGCAGCQ